LLKEARAKAAAAHMKAALQIIHRTTDFAQRQKALEHFALAKKYSNTYQNEINHESAAIYYDEGMRIFKMYPDFQHRLKAVYYFDKANTFIPNYNNSNPMLASLFYQEGARLASSKQLNDLIEAKEYLSKTIQYVPDYKNTATLLKEVNNKGAWLLYQAAKAKETEGTFQSEAEAANLYKQADQWIPGYLDAAYRAQKAKRCSVADVIVINPKGEAIEPYKLPREITKYTPPYVHFPRLTNAMTNINLNYPDNYRLFARRLGNGFILVKLNKNQENTPEFIRTAPQITTRQYVTYTQQVIKDEKPVTKTITESQYNQLKALNVRGLSKHEGYVKTTVTQTLLMTNERIEVWDVRKPEHPVMIDMIVLPSRIRSTQKQVTVYGDKKALPDNIRTGTFGQLKTKQELLEEFKAQRFLPYLNRHPDQLLRILNDEIAFRKL
jgi:tetratricopeptide (TPR) repeat protein